MGSMRAANWPRRLDHWARHWTHLWDDVEAFNALGPIDDDSISFRRLRLMRRELARRHPLELDRLLRVLGIDAAALERHDPARLHEMEVVCASCRDWRRCREAERNGTLRDTYESFCLNRLTLKALMRAVPEAGVRSERA
jgi:hypothetical protein